MGRKVTARVRRDRRNNTPAVADHLPADVRAQLEAARKAASSSRPFTLVRRYLEPILGSEAMKALEEAVVAYESAKNTLEEARKEARRVRDTLERALALAQMAGARLRPGTALERKLEELVLEQARADEARAEADAKVTAILSEVFEIPDGESGYSIFRKIESGLLKQAEAQKAKAPGGEQQPPEAETGEVEAKAKAEAASPIRAAAEALAEALSQAGAEANIVPDLSAALNEDEPSRVGEVLIEVQEGAAVIAAFTPAGWVIRRAEKARRIRKAAKMAASWRSITAKRVMDLLDLLK